MPETPDIKLREPPPPPADTRPAALAYAELDVTTNFSFLRGASHPDELVFRAAVLGYRAIAVADRNTLAGVVRAYDAAKQVKEQGGHPPQLIVGARLAFADAPDLLVYPTDRAAYGRLCRLLTLGKRRAAKGECILYLQDFLKMNEGMLAVIDECGTGYQPVNREGKHGQVARATFEGPRLSRSPYSLLREALGDRLSLAASALYGADDLTHLNHLADLSKTFDIPLLATNHVHYHDAGRRRLQDVLTCVRHTCTIDAAGFRLFPNGERYLKTPKQMHDLFAGHPRAIRRGIEIAERCRFSLDELKYEYPHELVPEGMSPIEYLRRLAYQGAAERYGKASPPDVGSALADVHPKPFAEANPTGDVPEKIRGLLDHELAIIAQQGFEPYFLTVYDLVRFARGRGILCQGRGSAANSAVCYCLGVTSVDPAKVDLLFERFISAARNEPPDIDVDFEHERREEVIQYLYQKYGRERAGMTAEVITYRGRSAVRDVGKAMGLSLDLVDQMAKKLDWWHRGTLTTDMIVQCGLDPNDRTVRKVLDLTTQLLGFPRHLSQHVGGMVMTRGPLCELVPIENASMADRTVIEWDKDDIDTLGILKVDALALGMLTAISKAFALINRFDKMRQGLRDKGTEGLREEGHGADTHVSGTYCLAESNGPGTHGISCDARHASLGAVRVDEPNEAGRLLDPVEHCRRLCATKQTGLPEVPSDRPRFIGRVVHSGRTSDNINDDAGQSSVEYVAGRRGSHFTVPHHEPGEKGAAGEKAIPLSPSVPQSLSPSVPLPLQLHTIPSEDPLVYDMISDADTVGVFQIESRAQMTMLPRLRPRCFYDLVIEVAIVRPGPIQGNMVHPYLRRRNGEEPVSYPSEALRNVLEKTLGVPLFQEQAMRVAMVGAGFSAAEADQLRRAMAAWRKNGAIEGFYPKIINGMLANGYTREFAEQCFNQIKGFGEYGFPESHAASFALLVYVSAWLKRYHPAAFAAGLLNSQPMGFYAPAQLVRDAKEHGVTVRPIDVNCSDWDCTLEDEGLRDKGTEGLRENASPDHSQSLSPSVPQSLLSSSWGKPGPALRLGLRLIKGLREDHARQLVAARHRFGPFRSLSHFHRTTALPVHALRRLAEADAFASLNLTRRQAVWQALELKDDDAPLFDQKGLRDKGTKGLSENAFPSHPQSLSPSVPQPLFPDLLPPMPLGQEVMTDYATTTLSLKKHPVSLIRDHLRSLKVVTAADVAAAPAGKWVKVAGLVLIRQRPGTASGIVFETLEDETGVVNLIVRPDVFERYRPAARHAGLLQADGYVERQGQVVHVMAKRLFDLSHLLSGFQLTSRDFH